MVEAMEARVEPTAAVEGTRAVPTGCRRVAEAVEAVEAVVGWQAEMVDLVAAEAALVVNAVVVDIHPSPTASHTTVAGVGEKEGTRASQRTSHTLGEAATAAAV